jgi:hypothetical protein
MICVDLYTCIRSLQFLTMNHFWENWEASILASYEESTDRFGAAVTIRKFLIRTSVATLVFPTEVSQAYLSSCRKICDSTAIRPHSIPSKSFLLAGDCPATNSLLYLELLNSRPVLLITSRNGPHSKHCSLLVYPIVVVGMHVWEAVTQ